MKLSDALRKAQGMGLDVVEIAPTANPPVCKIVALGKFRYDISKHERDKRPGGAKLKEIKFRVNIDDHDYLTKIRHGEEFLDRGNKVRVQLQFRGREMAHQEFGMQLMEKVRDDLAGMSQVEMAPKITGRNITMTLTPLPSNPGKGDLLCRRKQLTKASPLFRRTARKELAAATSLPPTISRGEYASQGVRAAAGDAFGDLAGGGGSGAFAACRASNRALRLFAS